MIANPPVITTDGLFALIEDDIAVLAAARTTQAREVAVNQTVQRVKQINRLLSGPAFLIVSAANFSANTAIGSDGVNRNTDKSVKKRGRS